MPQTQAMLNEEAVCGAILDSFPDKDLLNIDHERQHWNLYDLEQAAKESGCSLFLFVVREIREGANEQLPEDRSQSMMYTVDSIVKLLKRGRDDLDAVIRKFENF